MKNRYEGIGVMTGTSMDGADLAYCAFTQSDGNWNYEILLAETIPFSPELKADLLLAPNTSSENFIETDRRFAHFIGKAIKGFCNRHQLEPQFAVSHGQTIFHQPEKKFTFQLGDGETIVSHLSFPLVSNLRSKDVSLGGQGAPLVPFGETMLFPGNRLFLNLGGIANISYGNLAYDVCVCNLALNTIANWIDPNIYFDESGELASLGKVNEDLLNILNQPGYFSNDPPKSMGREWFEKIHLPLIQSWKNQPGIKMNDLLCTYGEHIATLVLNALKKMQPRNESLVITGGGAKNKFLISRIEERAAEAGVSLSKNISPLLVDFKEAMIFSFLGLMVLLGKTNIFSSVTGAASDVCGGSIHLPPSGWELKII